MYLLCLIWFIYLLFRVFDVINLIDTMCLGLIN